MIIYTDEEIQRIEKARETNDRLEEFFKKKIEDWNKSISPLFDILKLDLNKSNVTKIMDGQASALSFKQMLSEEISMFLNKRSKEEVKLKKLKQDKFIFYSTGFGLKTNMGEKIILIEGNIAENQRTLQIIENYIEINRSSIKNLDNLNYGLKNVIELLTLLSK